MKVQSKANHNNYRVPALEKGLDILEALSNAQMPLSLTDLSKSLEKTSSELFRMVDCLERRGYINKDDFSGNYTLSLKLFELAHNHSPVEQLTRVAYKPMWELSRTVRESCHLSVLQHGKLVVLSQAESPEKLRVSVEVGAYFSIIRTVSGRLLLSQMSADKLDAELAGNEEYQAMSPKQKLEFRGKLEQIRKEGHASSENETLQGIKDISVLVGNPKIGIGAALAIPYLTPPDNPDYKEELLQELRKCAETINKAMGVSS
ncbi:IclR family transcriptional regulator [Ammoniphilus resinae]|nr:IclR family transcriptional regulator [Ammoniphilus resinae]